MYVLVSCTRHLKNKKLILSVWESYKKLFHTSVALVNYMYNYN